MIGPHSSSRVIARMAAAVAVFAVANAVVYRHSSYFQTAREYHALMAEIRKHPNVSALFAFAAIASGLTMNS